MRVGELEKMGEKSQVEALTAIARLAGNVSQARTTATLGNFAFLGNVAALKGIAKSKIYKLLDRKLLSAMFPGRDPATLPERCETADDLWDLLGTSRQRVSESIKQLDLLGREFVQRAAELQLPQNILRIAAKLDDPERRALVKSARDPDTSREVLVKHVKQLAREAGTLEAEREAAEDKVREAEAENEKGREKVRKLNKQVRGLKNEVAKVHEGRWLPENEKEQVKELGLRSARLSAFLGEVSRWRWGDADVQCPYAVAFASQLLDEATAYFEAICEQHGTPAVGDRRFQLVKQYAGIARDAATALAAPKAKKANLKGPKGRAVPGQAVPGGKGGSA